MDQLRGPLSLPLQPADRRGGAFRGASAFFALAVLTAMLAACAAPAQVPWRDSFDSPDALARAVLSGLAAGDTSRLARYALSEHELRTTVWPSLPASRPEVGMPWDYFWRDHAQRNSGHLQTLVGEHRRRGYDFVGVSFAGRAQYGRVTVHREAALDVRTAAGPKRLRLSGSMVEMNGRWKLYSYVVD